MTRNITAGLKSIAVAGYALHKIKPGVAAAADLQEAMIDVRMNLMRSGKDASVLGRELAQVRSTAIDLQKITPFSSTDMVRVQNEMLSSGIEYQDVVGKGAARAASILATITKTSAESATGVMLGIGVPYQLKGQEYNQVGDMIQRHVMSGRMKMPQLEAALPYAAPYTKAFGVPWEDMLTGLAVLGEQGDLGSMAGTGIKDFYQRLTGASRISRRVMASVNQNLKGKGQAPLEFWDQKGEMLPTYDIIKNLRSSMGNFNRKQRMFILEKIFGEQGGLAALNLMSTGTGSWEFVKQKVLEVASAEDKMTERLKGFSANVTALGGTAKSTLATLFDPMLEPMTSVLKMLNEMVGKIGELADKHPVVANAASGVATATVATAIGYGGFKLIQGLFSGKKVLDALGGLKGAKSFLTTGLGIAEGKAVQAATGVTPVFVTNWPANLGAGSAAETMKDMAEGGIMARIGSGLIKGGAALGVGFAAYEIGSLLEEKFIKGRIGEWLYDKIHGGDKQAINLSVHIDSQGRVSSFSDDLKTSINPVKRGRFFSPMAMLTTAGMGY